jgi:quercetin dioxygenase-like cupin family protein
MSTPIVIAPGGGEVVADSPDRRLEVLCEDDALHVTWSRFGPRRQGANLHVHRHHADIFYVLQGELTIRLGADDELVPAPAGTFALVPPMVVHGFRNGTDVDVRYLNLHAPGMAFADYLRALSAGRAHPFDQHQPPSDGGRPKAEAIIARPSARPGVVVLADTGEIEVSEVCCDPGDTTAQHGGIYVLEGELALTVAERELRARAGSWLQLPRGAAHAVSSAGSSPVRFLNVRTA